MGVHSIIVQVVTPITRMKRLTNIDTSKYTLDNTVYFNLLYLIKVIYKKYSIDCNLFILELNVLLVHRFHRH